MTIISRRLDAPPRLARRGVETRARQYAATCNGTCEYCQVWLRGARFTAPQQTLRCAAAHLLFLRSRCNQSDSCSEYPRKYRRAALRPADRWLFSPQSERRDRPNHHLLRCGSAATRRLIWENFAHLLSVSLLPFSTAWIASSRLAPLPATVYASRFALVNATYLLLCWEAVDRPVIEEIPARARMMMRMRSLATLRGFVTAAAVSLQYPIFALGMICIGLAVYLKRQVDSGLAPHLASEDTTTLQAVRHPSSGTERCPSSPESLRLTRPNHPA